MASAELLANLARVGRRIAEAAAAAGRDPASVRLVAVSKTVSVEEVRLAMAAGQMDFGENRVQDLTRKAEALPGECTWHLIGHLQGNKVRPALKAATWIHSLDSIVLAERIERIAAEDGHRPNVLLQVNLTGEAAKSGVAPEGAEAVLRVALGCPHLRCCGLMTMAPFGAPETTLRRVFAGLRELRDRLQDEIAAPLPELSMGMSGDFVPAIHEGATLVRIGTAIFGERA